MLSLEMNMWLCVQTSQGQKKKDKLGNNPNILAISFSFIRMQDGGRGYLQKNGNVVILFIWSSLTSTGLQIAYNKFSIHFNKR